MESMYYIGLDVHKKTISYCVKDASGQVLQEGKIGATRGDLDSWMKTLPQPWSVAMEATIFTGWIYDHLLLLTKTYMDVGYPETGSLLHVAGRCCEIAISHVIRGRNFRA